jgi:hypothetical protein
VLIKATLIARLSERSVAAELRNARLGPGDPALGARAVRYGAAAYRVLYRTVNAAGQPARASGVLVFPVGRTGKLPLVDYGHGTTAYRLDVPSSFGLDAQRDGLEGRWSSELFASAGFAVAEPDYIGMGTVPGRPEYMEANAEASASLDLLRAAAAITGRLGHRLTSGILVTGFSQGGPAAMAVGHDLQQGTLPGFRMRALAPVSGPYDLPSAQLPGIFNGQIAAAIAPTTLATHSPLGNPSTTSTRLPRMRSPALRRQRGASIQRQPPLPADHHSAAAASAGPAHGQVSAPAYAPTRSLRAALIRNSTCTGWTPRVPVRLYAASGDTTMTQVNAQHRLKAIRARQGNARLVQLGAVSHNISDFLALPKIVRWFRTFG